MSQKIHIKLQYNNEFRRFVIEPESKYSDLTQKISTILNISTPFSVTYLDEEKEWITIDSDNELQIGIEICPTLLRLQIVDQQTPIGNQQSLQTPNPVVEEKRKYRKNKNSDTTSDKNGDEPKWKRFKKVRNENSEQTNQINDSNDDGPKWKRIKKVRNEISELNGDDANEEKKERFRGRGGRGGRGNRGGRGPKFVKQFENSESDSIEEKPADEIKKEIGSLKEEIQLLMQKKKVLGKNWLI